MSSLIEAYQKLQRRASITSSARFNASVRIQKRAALSIWAVSFVSVYLLLLSLTPLIVPEAAERYAKHIHGLNAVMSLVILVVSIIEAMRDHGKNAHLYHDAALKIRALQHAVSNAIANGNPTAEELSGFQATYDGILKDIPVNHLEIDVLHAELARGISRDSSAEHKLPLWKYALKFFVYARLWFVQFALYWLCIFGPPVIVIAFLCFPSVKA